MSLNPQLGSAPITAGGLPVTNNANLSLPYASGGGPAQTVSTFATASISSLTVSSINGLAPGGSLFQSTFNAVPCPGNTSTILMEMPAGQFGFNGLYIQTGASAYLNGYINTLTQSSGPFYWGSITASPSSQPVGSAPVEMTINNGDSGLSTIKLIVANTGSTAGSWTGVVSKLY